MVDDIWEGDLLGFKEIGRPFTNLVKTVDADKVISIEAGFGRGKTFFRKAWAKELIASGEVVIEIDVQESDHSGDPVVTLIGALVEALPVAEKQKKQAFDSAKRIAAVGARSITKALLKSGADEVIDAVTASAIDALDDFNALDALIKSVGEEMSKAAGQMIAAQMASEKIRKVEFPRQLSNLNEALVAGTQAKRVIVIIDELDRCHPDYAIAFLEAMKMVFSQSGFVFFLMTNSDYLERVARHRFGSPNNDEKYLEKFVDIRLKLEPRKETFKNAIALLASNLPLAIPFGDTVHFSMETASALAGDLAVHSGLSMRKVKRILLRVEVSLRCYSDRPLDPSLLIFLAFKDEVPDVITPNLLQRASFTPEMAEMKISESRRQDVISRAGQATLDAKLNRFIYENAPELLELPRERYGLPDDKTYKEWALVFKFLAMHYIPEHRNVLDAVAEVMVVEE